MESILGSPCQRIWSGVGIIDCLWVFDGTVLGSNDSTCLKAAIKRQPRKMSFLKLSQTIFVLAVGYVLRCAPRKTSKFDSTITVNIMLSKPMPDVQRNVIYV